MNSADNSAVVSISCKVDQNFIQPYRTCLVIMHMQIFLILGLIMRVQWNERRNGRSAMGYEGFFRGRGGGDGTTYTLFRPLLYSDPPPT